RAPAGDAVAHLEDLALATREHGEHAPDALAAQRLRGGLEGRLCGDVLDEVCERRVVLVADGLLERDRLLSHAQDLTDFGARQFELGRDLRRRRLAPELLNQLAL